MVYTYKDEISEGEEFAQKFGIKNKLHPKFIIDKEVFYETSKEQNKRIRERIKDNYCNCGNQIKKDEEFCNECR
jgi:hypothetical protein